MLNKNDQKIYGLEKADGKITLRDEDMVERGFVDYFIEGFFFYLKTINTVSGKGPKGSGALLVYTLTTVAKDRGFRRVTVTNATPEETGFYLVMGFDTDPAFLVELQKLSLPKDKFDAMKYTTLSADINVLFDKAGASVVKNWSDSAWTQKGLYAGHSALHGDMYHVPLD
jgi:hypothetical protein